MGSADEPNFKAIDASVGGLVWVQRRNGSWWPGQIVGLNEVTEDNLVSPKSGTPVRLLGREDASIDWYNLEKSKRVKPFRCGEYDECIEKAKASAASGNRRKVKYARREDAIIHALNIENIRLRQDPLSLSTAHYSASENCKEDENVNNEGSSTDHSGPDSAPDLSQSGLSFEESMNQNGVTKEQSLNEKRRRTPNDSEDDGTEGVVKRMRGLEDLGINGSKVYANSSLKRRRTQVANVQDILKRKHRRWPLTKVLQSSAVMISVPVGHDQIPHSSDSLLQVSGIESNESRKSCCVEHANNSDSTVASCGTGVSLYPGEPEYDDSHDNDGVKESDIVPGESGSNVNASAEETTPSGLSPPFLSSSPGKQEVVLIEKQQSGQLSEPESLYLLKEGLNESGSTSFATANVDSINQSIEKSSSKWQSKGKRNSRSIIRSISQCSTKYGIPDSMIPHKSLPLRQSRYTVHSKYETLDVPGKCCLSNLKLYTIEVEVNANYRQQNVPLVSLRSKMNGKAVVGHPLAVQLLEEGYCDRFSMDPVIPSSPSRRSLRGFSQNKSRKSGFLSKKTRKLSSLTGNNKSQDKKPVVGKLESPVIACIPLKLVFSRINEDVNGLSRPMTESQ